MQRAHHRRHQSECHAGLPGSGQRGVRHRVPHPVGCGRGRPGAGHQNGQRWRGEQFPGHDH